MCVSSSLQISVYQRPTVSPLRRSKEFCGFASASWRVRSRHISGSDPRSSTMSKRRHSSIRFRRLLDPRCYRCFFPPFPAAMAAKAAAESSRSVHITRVELDTRVHNVRCCAWPQDKCRAAVMGHFIFQRFNSVVLNRITLEIACSLRFFGQHRFIARPRSAWSDGRQCVIKLRQI